ANCTAATCQLDVGYSTSADGGASWTSNAQIAGPMSLSWLPTTTQGTMVGDYISTSFTGSAAYPAIAVGNAPSGSTFAEAIDTVRGGLSARATAIRGQTQSLANALATLSSSSLTDQ